MKYWIIKNKAGPNSILSTVIISESPVLFKFTKNFREKDSSIHKKINKDKLYYINLTLQSYGPSSWEICDISIAGKETTCLNCLKEIIRFKNENVKKT